MIRSLIQAYYKEYPESGSCYGMDSINFLSDRDKKDQETAIDENGDPIINNDDDDEDDDSEDTDNDDNDTEQDNEDE